jgi:hypothetical protein
VEKHYALTVSRKILSIFHFDDFVPFPPILQFHFKDVFIEAFGLNEIPTSHRNRVFGVDEDED